MVVHHSSVYKTSDRRNVVDRDQPGWLTRLTTQLPIPGLLVMNSVTLPYLTLPYLTGNHRKASGAWLPVSHGNRG
jgi:uncharacterized protein YceK